MEAAVVVAEIVRSGFVEGHHYGSWVALDADGSVRASAGNVEGPMFPRSCNKPIQALGMLEAGLALDGELLALACASHSGEEFHVEGVRRILASAGLSDDALQTPPDWPLDDERRESLLRAGESKAPILMNCSGKHAAMLATCVANGWPIDTYLAPDHPLQQALA
ncbi:MAG: asparaginase, partial [Marmoricola sp.]